MPGTTIAIDCLRPMVPRILSAAARAAGDGSAGAAAAGAAGARALRGGRRVGRLRRHAQGCEHEESETAFGDSGAGGHE